MEFEHLLFQKNTLDFFAKKGRRMGLKEMEIEDEIMEEAPLEEEENEDAIVSIDDVDGILSIFH